MTALRSQTGGGGGGGASDIPGLPSREDWMAGINSSERFIQYRKFKLVLEPEKIILTASDKSALQMRS